MRNLATEELVRSSFNDEETVVDDLLEKMGDIVGKLSAEEVIMIKMAYQRGMLTEIEFTDFSE